MSVATAAQTWTIDAAHTQVSFEVAHMMFAKVRGSFGELKGELMLGEPYEIGRAHV